MKTQRKVAEIATHFQIGKTAQHQFLKMGREDIEEKERWIF